MMDSENGTTRKVGIYARVSTKDQTVQNQLLDLRAYAARRNWVIEGEYLDEGVSGTRESRPALDTLLDRARKRNVDVVLVWRLDRLGRGMRHLVMLLDELRALQVEFVSFHENLDSATPLGRAVFGIFAVLAEMERELIVERVKAGLRRARREGKRLGRPRVEVDSGMVLKLHERGLSQREIAQRLSLSKTTVMRILKDPA
jgi:DNA invertase Pin-like site-specific DNA recombinase